MTDPVPEFVYVDGKTDVRLPTGFRRTLPGEQPQVLCWPHCFMPYYDFDKNALHLPEGQFEFLYVPAVCEACAREEKALVRKHELVKLSREIIDKAESLADRSFWQGVNTRNPETRERYADRHAARIDESHKELHELVKQFYDRACEP